MAGNWWRFAVGILVVAGIGLLVWLDAYWITQLVWEGRKLFRWIALIVLLGVVVAAAVRLGGDSFGVLAGWVAGVLGTAGVIVLLLWSSYQVDRGYADQATVVEQAVPGLAPRVPYLVGKAQSGTSLGDIAGDAADTTYLPDQDVFSTLVERRGWLSGYQAGFSQRVPLTGRGDPGVRCDFDTSVADARIGGLFGHNLGRLIAQHR